jgi:hypothetical protein
VEPLNIAYLLLKSERMRPWKDEHSVAFIGNYKLPLDRFIVPKDLLVQDKAYGKGAIPDTEALLGTVHKFLMATEFLAGYYYAL